MPKPKTNVQFVTDLMEFSRYGALAQVFVIDALDKWSKKISEVDPAQVDSAMINGEAWVGVAKEIQQKIEERK
ncbi:hypothetical protein [Bradyrhizobium sp. DASA03007]|uniref:hypothetical protein n=1 Tax=unclassified Bradyrhizobium TaxID=2631580 RepID=UPI003F71F6E5